MSVEGPVSASPFFLVNMVELTSCHHHHNLANALTLYTPYVSRSPLNAMMYDLSLPIRHKLKCMYDILTPPCTYGIPLIGMLA